MAGLPFVPRLLPMAMAAMVALIGVKTAGLVRQALAESSHKPPPTAASVPAAAGQGGHLPAKSPPAAPAPATNVVQPQVIVPPAPKPATEPPVSSAERALLQDLRKRRAELDAREAGLAVREGVLAAAEKRLAGRIEEMSGLQTRLEALETARHARDEENWRGLVKLYETMKPRDAAAIFNDLDRPVLLAVLDRMKESKAAPVLAAMQPERARQATTELARQRAKANRPADPPSAPPKPSG